MIMSKVQLDTVTNKEALPQTISKTVENIPKITTQQRSKSSSILLKLQIQRYALEKFYRRTVLEFLANPSQPLIDRNVLSGHSRYCRSSHWHSLYGRTLFARLSFVLLVIRCIGIRANGRSLVWSFALLALVAMSSRDCRSRYWHSLQCLDTLRHLPAISNFWLALFQHRA